MPLHLTIACIGRPNVGKSTLFNTLIGSKQAVVSDQPGVTRDRQYAWIHWGEDTFTLIDTAGWSDEKASQALETLMDQQTLQAIEEADVLWLITDATAGMTPYDQDFMAILRKTGKPVLCGLNQCDRIRSGDHSALVGEFATLGAQAYFPITALRRDALTELVEASMAWAHEDNLLASEAPDTIRFAIVGRPNVGKSTLTNRFLGADRMIVADYAGTTRDSITSSFMHHGQRYEIVDTAGARRQAKVEKGLESYCVTRTLQAIRLSHISLMVVDGHEAMTDQDLQMIAYIVEAGRGLMLLVNKWDNLSDYEQSQFKVTLEKRCRFIDFADTYFISAQKGHGLRALLPAIQKIHQAQQIKPSTGQLNRILQQAIEQHQPPLVNGRRIQLRYAHPITEHAQKIMIHGKQVHRLPGAYQQYLERFFRQSLGIHGFKLKLLYKTDHNPYTV